MKMKGKRNHSNVTNALKDAAGVLCSTLAFAAAFAFWLTGFMTLETVFASGTIQNSEFVRGTVRMMEDVTRALIILAPVVTIAVVGYCFIRKGAADEMDHKKWHTRITTAIVCCIGVICASIIVNVLIGYYT